MIYQRPIDEAMAANLPEKIYVRQLWADEIIRVENAGYDNQFPLYLTLPGASGGELNYFLEQGILRRTESGAIDEDDLHKIVAVESSKKAQVELLNRFPGLNVLVMPIQNLVRGDGQRNFPDNPDEIRYCKAKVINLDLNMPIMVDETINEILIPPIEWIKKFFIFHRESELDWTLCLTLHGEIYWNEEVNSQVIKFLVDNCDHDNEFKDSLVSLLGEYLSQSIFESNVDLTNIEQNEMQKIAMILIPKLLVNHAVNSGWIITTGHNYAYSGGGGSPMVTWVFNFRLDPNAAAQTITEYIKGIRNIFFLTGFINDEGNLIPFD